MIDYLEQLFAPEQTEKSEEAQIQTTLRTRLAQEEPEMMALPRTKAEEYWQEEAVRRLEHAVSDAPAFHRGMESIAPVEMQRISAAREEPETAERYSTEIRRREEERPDEVLERRLRRDSRRYDSGFYWY